MAVTETTENTYRILFHNQGQIYEVYARNIYQSDLYGFVEVEDYVFGNRSKMLIDPAEDRLRSEFEGVQRSYIPMHAIVRIDEVEKEGVAKITTDSGEKVTPFPMPHAERQELAMAGQSTIGTATQNYTSSESSSPRPKAAMMSAPARQF